MAIVIMMTIGSSGFWRNNVCRMSNVWQVHHTLPSSLTSTPRVQTDLSAVRRRRWGVAGDRGRTVQPNGVDSLEGRVQLPDRPLDHVESYELENPTCTWMFLSSDNCSSCTVTRPWLDLVDARARIQKQGETLIGRSSIVPTHNSQQQIS
jgi:hypothetical protein